MELNYYPGCSATSTGQEYDLSVRAVFKALGVELQELEDWNCCGASSAHCTSRGLALALGVEPAYRRAQLWRDIKARIQEHFTSFTEQVRNEIEKW